MKSKRSPKAKRLALRAAPLLLTDVRSAQWSGGVLYLDVESGPEAGAIALGPNAVLSLWSQVQVAIQERDVSPFAGGPHASKVEATS